MKEFNAPADIMLGGKLFGVPIVYNSVGKKMCILILLLISKNCLLV